jgi:lysophospholipase L1-like esterase
MRLALMCASTVMALALAEVTLRAAHFEFRVIPTVQFGWPEPQALLNDFRSDPDLIWVTPDYFERLAEAHTTRARVIFLGDSCVEYSTYPGRALARLKLDDPHLGLGEKLSVPGWSSEQGRAQAVRDVATLRPRVVVVEFGWNDHWDALGPPDDETHPGAVVRWASEHLRVYQAYRRAVVAWQMRRQQGEPPRRVSLERYRENLRVIAESVLQHGAKVVFVTAPTSHEAGHEPEYLRARHLRNLTRLVSLHQSYVQATREVAAAERAALCDAASAIEQRGDGRRFFRNDGIHFNGEGDVFMGDFVAGCIQSALH